MKIEVNGTNYDIDIIGDKALVNGKEMGVNLNEDEIKIGGDIFRLDFVEEGDEQDPQILEALRRIALTLTLSAGETLAVDLRLTP